MTNEPLIRRRLRAKLRALLRAGKGGPFAGSLLDEDDILATTLRRVDAAAAAGRVCADDPRFAAYVDTVIRNACNERLRQAALQSRHLSAAAREDHVVSPDLESAAVRELIAIIEPLLSPKDWEECRVRIAGTATDSPPAGGAARKRWSRLVQRLRGAFRRFAP